MVGPDTDGWRPKWDFWLLFAVGVGIAYAILECAKMGLG